MTLSGSIPKNVSGNPVWEILASRFTMCLNGCRKTCRMTKSLPIFRNLLDRIFLLALLLPHVGNVPYNTSEWMKLLFDQNISFRILNRLPAGFADCLHVKSVGLNNHNDMEIWQFAKKNGFTIVTFDADFFDLSLVRNFPPKIIWLRTGNMTTDKIVDCIILNYSNIVSFIDNPTLNCLEIY